MKLTTLSAAVTAALKPLRAMLDEVSVATNDIKGYTKRNLACVNRPSVFSDLFKEFIGAVFGLGAAGIIFKIAQVVTGLKGGASIMAALKLIGFGCSAMLGLGILGVIAIGGYVATKALLAALDEDIFRDNVTSVLVGVQYIIAGTITSFEQVEKISSKDNKTAEIFKVQMAAVTLLSEFKVDLKEVKTQDEAAEINCDIIKNVKHSADVNISVQRVFKETSLLLTGTSWEDISSQVPDEKLQQFGMVLPTVRSDYRRKNFGKIRSDLAAAYISANT